jgi:hypothetical protein
MRWTVFRTASANRVMGGAWRTVVPTALAARLGEDGYSVGPDGYRCEACLDEESDGEEE